MDISLKLAAVIIIVVVGAVQCVAFAMGYNGQVFAFTSLAIGALIGLATGIPIKYKQS